MSNKHVLITGGTGFIGKQLTPLLVKQGYQVTLLTRSPHKAQQLFGDEVNTLADIADISKLPAIDGVINLAGEGILDKRWSKSRKQVLLASRVELTEKLVAALIESSHKPACFISGSAVGYYGDRGDEPCPVNSKPGNDFSAMLCKQWETAAKRIKDIGCRLVIIRTGIVLDKKGGALERMILPFRLGLGGKIGSGKQWFPWIHRTDFCRMILFLLEDSRCSGPYNGTAPIPVTNKEFTQALGKAQSKPTLLPVPGIALKLALGEASELLLGGQNATPDKILQEGFKFKYTTIERCLKDCV